MSKKPSQQELRKIQECQKLNELIDDRNFFANAILEIRKLYTDIKIKPSENKDYRESIKMLGEIEDELFKDYGIPHMFMRLQNQSKTSSSKTPKRSQRPKFKSSLSTILEDVEYL